MTEADRRVSSPTIEVHLAPHGEQDKKYVLDSNSRIEKALQETSGKVVVLLESPYVHSWEAKNFEILTDLGVRPLIAIGFVTLANPRELGGLLSRLRLDDEVAYEIANVSLEDSWVNLLAPLDKMWAKYRDGNGNSRLKLIFESSDTPLTFESGDYVDTQEEVSELVKSGDFAQALEIFKRNVRRLAESSKSREEDIVGTIVNYPDAEAIFIRFGAAHSGIYHMLKRMKLNASLIQFDKDSLSHSYHYAPESAAARKVMFMGFDSINDLEWYQAMLKSFMLGIVYRLDEMKSIGMTEQEMIAFVSSVSAFETLDEVEAFRRKVQAKGIVAALEEIDSD